MAAKKWLKNSLSPHTNYSKQMGADPEMFVEDEEGMIIPAWSFMRSEKEIAEIKKLMKTNYNEAAKRLTAIDNRYGFAHGGGGYVYYDGYQGEFNMSPFMCHDGGTSGIQNGLLRMLREAKAFNPKAKLSMNTTPYIPAAVRESATEDQNALGCKPSMNAYGLSGEVPPDPKELTHRFAGGHLHFSGMYEHRVRRPTDRVTGVYTIGPVQMLWNGEQLKASASVDPIGTLGPYVKALDRILGVWSIGVFAEIDNPIRRQYYGLPGEFRAPTHGLEYRTLSNAWMMFGPSLGYLTMGLARICLAAVDNDIMQWWIDKGEEDVVSTIRNYDVARSREIIEQNKDLFDYLVDRGVAAGNGGGPMAREFNKVGCANFYQEPANIAKNWDVDALANGQLGGLHFTSTLRWSSCVASYLKPGKKIPTLESLVRR